MLRSERSEYAAGERSVEGGGGGFAADVADGEGGAACAEVEVVVDVAPDGAGGDKFGCDLGALELRRARGHETELDLTCHLEVALHALLFLVNTLVETGVGDTDGDLRGEG